MCYNNAIGLYHIDDSRIRVGDRICGFLFRTSDIVTRWRSNVTYTTKGSKFGLKQKFDKDKRNRSNNSGRKPFGSSKRIVAHGIYSDITGPHSCCH